MDRFTRNVSLMGLGLLVFLGVSINMVMKGGLKGWDEANETKEAPKGVAPGATRDVTEKAVLPQEIAVTVFDDKGEAVEGAQVHGMSAKGNTQVVTSDARGQCIVKATGEEVVEWIHAGKEGVGQGQVKAEVGKPVQIVLAAGFAAETRGAGEGAAVSR